MEGIIVDYHRVERMLRELIAQSLIVDPVVGKAAASVCSVGYELVTNCRPLGLFPLRMNPVICTHA